MKNRFAKMLVTLLGLCLSACSSANSSSLTSAHAPSSDYVSSASLESEETAYSSDSPESQKSESSSSSQEHVHVFSSEWSHDDTYHWHPSICDHNVVSDKEEHHFGEWVIDIVPTEYQVGSQYRVCVVCDFRQDADIPKLEHAHKPADPVEENREEPTCIMDGSYELVTYCSECQQELSRELKTIGKLGHDLIHHDGFPATCTDDGWAEYDTCSRCDYTTYETIPATGHLNTETKEENRVEATCTREGSYDLVTYCLDDGVELHREHKTIPALGHDLVHNAGKSATCTEDGWVEYDTCTRCDYTTYESIEAKGHAWGAASYEWSADYSTCTARRVCANDESHVESEIADSSYWTVSNPDYGVEGQKVYDAYFENEAFEGQTVEIAIPALNCVAYTLNEDGISYSAAKASDTIKGDIVIADTWNGFPVTAVGDRAFYGCKSITSIVIPNSVTIIGNYAFSQCSSLSVIDLPVGIQSIGQAAFGGTSITEIAIPTSFTAISDYLFAEMYSLQSIDIPQRILSIGDGAFRNCQSLSALQIPNSVTSIGRWAFNQCTSLESLAIPDSVVSIGESTFAKCSSLKSISLPSNLENISEGLMASCSSLESLVIPNRVSTIYRYAFSDCTALLSIKIPNSVNLICESAFSGCSAAIEWGDDPSIESLERRSFVGWKGQTISIPNSVTAIKESAFVNCSFLLSIAIPDTVIEIGNYAFSNCSSLSSIDIPESVTSLGMGVFRGCSALASVSISAYLEAISGGMFRDCVSLSSIEIPSSVNSFGSGGTFDGCTSLTSVNIPSGVTLIPWQMFRGCSSLASIDLPEGITEIGEDAFSGCSSLLSINIPSTVTRIRDRAFGNCTNLVLVVNMSSLRITPRSLDDGIGGVSHYATYVTNDENEFDRSKITMDENGFIIYRSGEKVTLLRSTSKEAMIVIPDYVTEIGKEAFYDCDTLLSVTIPNSVTSIGEYAFWSCSSLTTVSIPNSVTSVGDYAFCNCENLFSISLGNGLQTIGEFAFQYCWSLISIVIPDSVSMIENGAFDSCYALAVVVNKSSLNIAKGSYDFSHITTNAYIVSDQESDIQSISIDSYGFATIFLDNRYTLIRYLGTDSEVVIPDYISIIGPHSMASIPSIVSISVPDTVTSIGESAFAYCHNLMSLNLGKGIVSLPKFLFVMCESLSCIEIPNSVTSIGFATFYAAKIESIIIPKSVTRIGGDNFQKFFHDSPKFQIFYCGTSSEWDNVAMGTNNDYMTAFYYSEIQPSSSGNYWHYVNGVPTIW